MPTDAKSDASREARQIGYVSSGDDQIACATMAEVAVIPGPTRDADRAGVLVATDAEVALIERRREGLHYWVAPGGGVEPGETPEVAAAREALEELGLHVEIRQKVLELRGLHPRGWVQHYLLATSAEREFRGMTGPERPTASNIYVRRWVRLDRVATLNVLPAQLAAFLVRVPETGWSDEPVVIDAS